MCTLEDAWGTMSSQQRQSFGSASDKPYARFGQLAERPGHFSCNGSFVTETGVPTGVQAVATPERREYIVVPEKKKKPKKERLIVVEEPSCGKTWQHMLECPMCRHHRAEQMRWWHWLLVIVGTALLAALFVRWLQPSSRTVYRQIGIKI